MSRNISRALGGKGAEALFGAALAYGTTGVLVRQMEAMWGDKAQVAVRYCLVLIFLVFYGLLRKKKSRIPANKLPYAIGLGVLFALVVLFFTFSIQKTTIANSYFTFYATTMTISFLLGTFVLKEKVSKTKVIAIIFALAGLSLYANTLAAGSLGLVFGVLAGAADGVSNLQRKLLTGVDRNAVLRMQYAVGTVVTVLVTLLSGDAIIRTVSVRGVLVTIIFAGVLIAAGNLLLYGYQHFDVNIGTVIMSMELVFAVVLAYSFYREVPERRELIGGALILTGSILSSLDFGRFRRFLK